MSFNSFFSPAAHFLLTLSFDFQPLFNFIFIFFPLLKVPPLSDIWNATLHCMVFNVRNQYFQQVMTHMYTSETLLCKSANQVGKKQFMVFLLEWDKCLRISKPLIISVHVPWAFPAYATSLS